MELTEAQKADMEAADEAFRKEIPRYTVQDLKGLAPLHVSQKLRSEKFFDHWKDEISKIKAMGGPLATVAQTRFVEIKQLRVKYNVLRYERSGIQLNVKDVFGEPPPEGTGLDSVIVWCLCKIYQRLKKKDETL